jgi:hypothetical protein
MASDLFLLCLQGTLVSFECVVRSGCFAVWARNCSHAGRRQRKARLTVLARVAIPRIVCPSSTSLGGPLLTLYPALGLIGHVLINCQPFSRVVFRICICHWAKSREKVPMPYVAEGKYYRRCTGWSGCFTVRSCLEIGRSLRIGTIAESGFDSRADVLPWSSSLRLGSTSVNAVGGPFSRCSARFRQAKVWADIDKIFPHGRRIQQGTTTIISAITNDFSPGTRRCIP